MSRKIQAQKAMMMSLLFALLLMTTACPDTNDPQCTMEQLKTELTEIRQSGEKQKRNKPWPVELRERAEAGRDKVTTEWLRCTRKKAMEYLALSETAEAVADASLSVCSEWSFAYKVWNSTVFQAAGSSVINANETYAIVQKRAKEDLIAFVMDMRVRRSRQGAPAASGQN
ncbi:hypothetical protein [Sphingopyxis sp. P8]|uniref:hypothetical protein n=1 Tax=Sphingopyxis sp. P8 TaxID=2763256 RepID=UPI001D0B8602|nr:hypothetical protein [Sphingopyxis sp. P8]